MSRYLFQIAFRLSNWKSISLGFFLKKGIMEENALRKNSKVCKSSELWIFSCCQIPPFFTKSYLLWGESNETNWAIFVYFLFSEQLCRFKESSEEEVKISRKLIIARPARVVFRGVGKSHPDCYGNENRDFATWVDPQASWRGTQLEKLVESESFRAYHMKS